MNYKCLRFHQNPHWGSVCTFTQMERFLLSIPFTCSCVILQELQPSSWPLFPVLSSDQNPTVENLTFNLGVTLLLEHLPTPESEKIWVTERWDSYVRRQRNNCWKKYGIQDGQLFCNCLSHGKCMALARVLWSTEWPPRWNRQSNNPGEGWGGLTACKRKRLKWCADYAWATVIVQPQKEV